jgi:RNA polymerase sigma factor (TIGR02999 family)
VNHVCYIDSRVYDELLELAICHLRREGSANVLDPTDLVSEVYLRLAASHIASADCTHFLAIASRKMRQILVDHARKRFATKRRPGSTPVELDETLIATDRPRELVALDDALDALVRHDERKARVTALHYFGGLTHEEIAAICGLHANTVSRDLRDSEEWLRCRMKI